MRRDSCLLCVALWAMVTSGACKTKAGKVGSSQPRRAPSPRVSFKKVEVLKDVNALLPGLLLTFSPSGRYLAGGHHPAGWDAIVFDTATWRRVAELSERKKGPHYLAFTPDEKHLVIGDGDGAYVVAFPSGTIGPSIAPSLFGRVVGSWMAGRPRRVAWLDTSVDDEENEPSKIDILDIDSGTRLTTLKHPTRIYNGCVTGKQRYLATVAADGYVRFWNVVTGKMVGRRKTGKDVPSMRCMSQRPVVAIHGREKEVWIVLGPGEPRPASIPVYRSRRDAVVDVAFLHRRGYILVVCTDQYPQPHLAPPPGKKYVAELQVWSYENGKAAGSLVIGSGGLVRVHPREELVVLTTENDVRIYRLGWQ